MLCPPSRPAGQEGRADIGPRCVSAYGLRSPHGWQLPEPDNSDEPQPALGHVSALVRDAAISWASRCATEGTLRGRPGVATDGLIARQRAQRVRYMGELDVAVRLRSSSRTGAPIRHDGHGPRASGNLRRAGVGTGRRSLPSIPTPATVELAVRTAARQGRPLCTARAQVDRPETERCTQQHGRALDATAHGRGRLPPRSGGCGVLTHPSRACPDRAPTVVSGLSGPAVGWPRPSPGCIHAAPRILRPG